MGFMCSIFEEVILLVLRSLCLVPPSKHIGKLPNSRGSKTNRPAGSISAITGWPHSVIMDWHYSTGQ